LVEHVFEHFDSTPPRGGVNGGVDSGEDERPDTRGDAAERPIRLPVYRTQTA
jgi:hypothetical protein